MRSEQIVECRFVNETFNQKGVKLKYLYDTQQRDGLLLKTFKQL